MEKIKKHKIGFYSVAFLFYLLFIIWFCLLSRQPDERKVSMLGETFIAIWKYPWTWILLVMAIANVILYIPVGLILERITRNKKVTLFIGGVISIGIEAVQFVTCRGTLDVDDFLNNLAGVIIGAALVEWIAYNRKEITELSIWLKVSTIICGIYSLLIARHVMLHLFWNSYMRIK